MLTTIGLQNFKIFRDVSIEPKLITIFIGPNGSGKSTVLQALLLLKQSLGGGALQPKGQYIDLGEIEGLRHFARPSSPMIFDLAGSRSLPDLPFEGTQVSGRVTFQVHTVFENGQVSEQEGRIRLQHPRVLPFTWRATRDSSRVDPPRWVPESIIIAFGAGTGIGQPIYVSGGSYSNVQMQQQYEEAWAFFETLFSIISDSIANIYFVPANRGFTQADYDLSEGRVSDFPLTQGMAAYERATASNIVYDRDTERLVSQWTKHVTEASIDHYLKDGPKVVIRAQTNDRQVNIINEGFGSNQLAFFLAYLAASPSGCTIGIEEPELHLHPRAQARLMEVLMWVAKQHNKQMLLTTHSEHILARVLTAIAAREVKLGDEAVRFALDDVAVYYFERVGDTAKATPLEIDEMGRVKGGLPGFFDVGIEEALRHLEALKRQQ